MPRVLVVDADRIDDREYLGAIAPVGTARSWAEADLVVDRVGRVLKWRGRVAPAAAGVQAEGAGETGDQSARGRAVDLIDDVEHDCPVWVGERAVSALEAAGLRIAIRTTDEGA